MGRKKLQKFDFNIEAKHIVQHGKDNFENISGNWNKVIFEKEQPIILEIGCGQGDYVYGLGALFPENNYIGVDVKGSRLYKGAKKAMDDGFTNMAYLRLSMHELDKCFVEGEVEEFWITFPDPRPRDRDERRRLVYPRYLNLYRKISRAGAVVNLKTDNHDFYLYALEVCKQNNLEVLVQTDDLYQSEFLPLCHGVQTTYEKKYLSEGIKINYLKFRL